MEGSSPPFLQQQSDAAYPYKANNVCTHVQCECVDRLACGHNNKASRLSSVFCLMC